MVRQDALDRSSLAFWVGYAAANVAPVVAYPPAVEAMAGFC